MSDTANITQGTGLLAGLLTRAQLGAATGWGDRTILRREAAGLPVISIGDTRLYPEAEVRQWILSRIRRAEARGRGRPRKAPAEQHATTAA